MTEIRLCVRKLINANYRSIRTVCVMLCVRGDLFSYKSTRISRARCLFINTTCKQFRGGLRNPLPPLWRRINFVNNITASLGISSGVGRGKLHEVYRSLFVRRRSFVRCSLTFHIFDISSESTGSILTTLVIHDP